MCRHEAVPWVFASEREGWWGRGNALVAIPKTCTLANRNNICLQHSVVHIRILLILALGNIATNASTMCTHCIACIYVDRRHCVYSPLVDTYLARAWQSTNFIGILLRCFPSLAAQAGFWTTERWNVIFHGLRAPETKSECLQGWNRHKA